MDVLQSGGRLYSQFLTTLLRAPELSLSCKRKRHSWVWNLQRKSSNRKFRFFSGTVQWQQLTFRCAGSRQSANFFWVFPVWYFWTTSSRSKKERIGNLYVVRSSCKPGSPGNSGCRSSWENQQAFKQNAKRYQKASKSWKHFQQLHICFLQQVKW